MNIQEFRALMDAAFREEGLEHRQLLPDLRPRRPKVWTLPETDIIRYFLPHAYRRPWGFVLGGGIGIEIPALRDWLGSNKLGDEAGIFTLHFVGYHIANEDVLNEFMAEHGSPVPADLWAGLIKDRLLRIPATQAELVNRYKGSREGLEHLVHPHHRHAWDFLFRWIEEPRADLHVPRMLPTGHIV